MSAEPSIRLINPHQILVVGAHGGLRQLHTPFRVRCIGPVETFRPGTIYFVEKVFKHPRLMITYWINGRLIGYRFFEVILTW
jgi:hypothetical protein